jgi:hypothetical protein
MEITTSLVRCPVVLRRTRYCPVIEEKGVSKENASNTQKKKKGDKKGWNNQSLL